MYVGIDWATSEHAICIIGTDGRVAERFVIDHSAAGFDRLIARLARHGDPAMLPVAIERPDGRLVDRLLEAGHPVVAVKTTAIKAWREAEIGSGAKSDPGDAQVIADYLRLREHELRRLTPFSEESRALRAVVRSRSELVEARVAAGNQLRATLAAAWPGADGLFADVTSEISLAFLARYPTAASATRLGEARMAMFLKRHGYSGRRSPAELLERLRAAPAGLAAGAEAGAWRDVVLAMVRVIEALNHSLRELDRSVVAHLGEHPDAVVFRSLPRAGQVNAAQMLAEWGDCREAYDGPEAVAALSGMAPVTRRSGKHLAVGFRWACNTRFRNAMATFADNSRHASPWAASIYGDAIGRGADHPHAVRHPRACLDPGHLSLLDRRGRLRPLPPWCRETARSGGTGVDRGLGLTQRVSSGSSCGWSGGHVLGEQAEPCEDEVGVEDVGDGGQRGGGRRPPRGLGPGCGRVAAGDDDLGGRGIARVDRLVHAHGQLADRADVADDEAALQGRHGVAADGVCGRS